MADSLAFSITVPRHRLPQFVACLAAHLEPDSPWSEQAVLASAESGSELPLTLKLLPDKVVNRFGTDNPEISCSVAGQVAVGYLFATVRAEHEQLEVAFSTSSRAIVHVLKESAQVRSLFLQAAGFGQPPELRITDEWNEVQTLHACGVA